MYAYYQHEQDLKHIRKCKALYEDDVNAIAERYGAKNPLFKFGRVCHDGSSPEKPTKVPTPRPTEWEPATRRPTRPRTTYRPEDPTHNSDRQHHEYATQRPTYYPKEIEKPNKCKTSFDAITVFRNELMIFKDKWIWRLEKQAGKYKPLPGSQPIEIKSMWRDMAAYDHIDAAFEMKNGNIAFFINRKVFIYNTVSLVGTSDLSHYGFDHKLKKVDAIFRWNYNNNTFIFSGKYYWK